MIKNNFRKFLWPVFVILVITNCVEPYQAPFSNTETNILVVDGFINTTTNSALVRLSRSIALSRPQQFPAEVKAAVSIESEDGVKYQLVEKSGGNYEITGLNLSAAKKYRLLILTQNGSQYQSDYINLNTSPILDAVSWTPEETGVTVRADAHDPGGLVKYYKWNYAETWEYTSNYESVYKIVKNAAVTRKPEDAIFKCWNTELSSKILIASTSRLSEAVVSKFALTFLPVGTIKLSRKYSILVQLRGVREEEFNYWQQLQKTNENLGGLFDPLPSQVAGNIHNSVDPSDVVLGYFSAAGMQEKRIFISYAELPIYLHTVNRPLCLQDTLLAAEIKTHLSALLISSYGSPTIIGYTTASNECIDCRESGGTLTKPAFWK